MNIPAKIYEKALRWSRYAYNDARGMLGMNRPLFHHARAQG